MSDPVTRDSIHPEMIIAAGSITKNFIAVLILQLTEEGVLTLEESLGQWLPAYSNIYRGIAIRQLLNHTSGIFNFDDNSKNASQLLDVDKLLCKVHRRYIHRY